MQVLFVLSAAIFAVAMAQFNDAPAAPRDKRGFLGAPFIAAPGVAAVAAPGVVAAGRTVFAAPGLLAAPAVAPGGIILG